VHDSRELRPRSDHQDVHGFVPRRVPHAAQGGLAGQRNAVLHGDDVIYVAGLLPRSGSQRSEDARTGGPQASYAALLRLEPLL
jgi:hypothetical protein